MFYKNYQKFTATFGNQEITVETGKLAQQTNGSAVVTMGGTTILATAVMSSAVRDGIDFFPLMVNYQERFYAAGLLKNSPVNKREGRPSDEKVLMGRVIDRTLRPLFPKGLKNDVQVMLMTLSYDGEYEHDMAAAVAASVAVSISDIPFAGPTASVRVGLINDEFILNPAPENRAKSDLDLIVSSSPRDVIMIEAGANQVPEAKMLEAIAFGKKWGQKICEFVNEIVAKVGKPKLEFTPEPDDTELYEWISKEGLKDLQKALFGIPGKQARSKERNEILAKLKEKAVEHFGEERDLKQFSEMGLKVWKKLIRNSILNDEKRIAERKLTEIRPLYSEVGLLQRTHGSALFQRGETQALSLVTLGAPSEYLIVPGIEGERHRRYMHHYNFPPFSVGEASNRLMTGNREIGHGALAERALEPVLPAKEVFPYVMRVVTEILESNGSSSMASVCGSTLSLMDAGVPITAPVAGIAMGLMVDPENPKKFKVLSDIQDEEDFGGDMDFKVAGTAKGITAIQMDTKILGISEEIFTEALTQAHAGRLHILENLIATIATPRADLSPYAPRLETLQINPEKIRLVIGKGGEMIQKITAETGCDIDIEQDGRIIIASTDGEQMKRAVAWIKEITAEAAVGATYVGKVMRLEPYGAFVEVLPGIQGLLHISMVANHRIEDINTVLKLGQEVKVKVVEINEGKVRLSMKDVQ